MRCARSSRGAAASDAYSQLSKRKAVRPRFASDEEHCRTGEQREDSENREAD